VNHFNLSFLGFGNVGRALARWLQEKRATLRDQYDLEWRITGVTSRRLGWLVNSDGFDVGRLLTGNFDSPATAPGFHEWLAASRANVMFETSSLDPQTGQPALDYIRAALKAGVNVVTANKGPVVHGYRELRELAANYGKHFRFEATVMGGAPIFSLFRETLPAANLISFRGLLNSTSNLIITEMEEGRTFDEAVKKAQDIGLAETDPSNDIDGWDASVKLAALATALMESPTTPQQVDRAGIRGLDAEQVRRARADGHPFKSVCRLERIEGRVVASVRLEQIPLTDPLASIRGASSSARFVLDTLPDGLTLISHNPGPATTAYDMLADFINIAKSD